MEKSCVVCGYATKSECECCRKPFCSRECQNQSHFIGAGSDDEMAVDEVEEEDEEEEEEEDEEEEEKEEDVEEDDAADEDAIKYWTPPAGTSIPPFGTRSSATEIPLVKRHESYYAILLPQRDGSKRYLPAHTELSYYEWADIPTELFKTPPPSGYRAQIHREGKRWRYRNSPTEEWKDSRSTKPMSDGRRRFKIRSKSIRAAVLVLSSFFGLRPTGRDVYEAGHEHAVAPGREPNEAIWALNWLTTTQNTDDKTRSGTANAPCTGQQLSFWARPKNSSPGAKPAIWKNETLGLGEDGYYWRLFTSQSEAENILGISRQHVGKLLSGKNTSPTWILEWNAAEEPAERDRVLVNTSEDTYVTRDGRLVQRKTRVDGSIDWVQFILTPASQGYIRVKTQYEHLSGYQQLHRLVFRAFAGDRILAKIERTAARNAKIDEALKNSKLTTPERKLLLQEKNGTTYADFHIDHKDSNPHNNRLDNLQILTKYEHMIKTAGHSVIETAGSARNSGVLTTFPSVTLAAAHAKTLQSTMHRRLQATGTASFPVDGKIRHFHKT